MADIAVSHYTSPTITAYPWSSGYGTKYSNPGTLVDDTGFGVTFSPSGNAVAIVVQNSPRVVAYSWTTGSGFGTKYGNPGTLPAGSGRGVSFSPSGNDIAIANGSSPRITAYPWTSGSGFGTKYSNPGTLPTGTGYGVYFSPSGNDIAIAHTTSPFVTVYPWTSGSGFGTKYSDPGTLPTGDGRSVAFSPSGNDIAVGHVTSPFVTVYPWTSGSGFGTKYSNPGTLPGADSFGVKGVAFSPSGNVLATIHSGSPYMTVYPWSGSGFGTKYGNAGSLPPSGDGIAFSPSGNDIAIAYGYSPYTSAWPWSSGFGTKYANPGTLPTSTSYGVAFSPDIVVPKISTLTDNFDDNSLNTTLWVKDEWGGTVSETSGLLRLTPTNNTAATGCELDSVNMYDLTSSSFSVRLVTQANGSVNSSMGCFSDANNGVEMLTESGTLYARKTVASTSTNLASVAMSSPVYLKIRETGGTTYWEYSTDSISWTTLASAANPITLTSVQVVLYAYEWEAVNPAGYADFDDVNIVTNNNFRRICMMPFFW